MTFDATSGRTSDSDASASPLLEAGALIMRTETELILKSRRVVPARLLERGFVFRYPTWRDAARNLCRQWRQTRHDGVRVA